MAMDSTQLAQNIGVRTASLYPSPKQRHCDHISETSVGSKVRSVAPTRPSTKLNAMTWPYTVLRATLPLSTFLLQHYVRGDPTQIGRTPKEGCATENVMICQNHFEKRMEPDTFHTLASDKPVVAPGGIPDLCFPCVSADSGIPRQFLLQIFVDKARLVKRGKHRPKKQRASSGAQFLHRF